MRSISSNPGDLLGRSRPEIIAVMTMAVASCAGARADWRAYLLQGHSGAFDTRSLAAFGGRSAGFSRSSSGYEAVLWESPEAGPISLHPPDSSLSEVLGMWGDVQVGQSYHRDDNNHTVNDAAMWHGTADSYVNLSPLSSLYSSSIARDVREQQIVGLASFTQTGREHAAIWTGPTFSTFVDLHNNTKAEWSDAYATDGEYQGGWALFRRTGRFHAALWHGSASTMSDMNPSWSGESMILGMAPGVQVGRAAPIGVTYQPVLWRGHADSAVIMTPAGFGGGELTATDGTRHVGQVSGYAGIWMSDDPNSFVNLAALVGNNVVGSSANAIYSDANHIYVAGQIRLGNGPLQGVVWVQEVPAPYSAALIVIGIAAMGRRRRG